MGRVERISCKAELFKFLLRNISNEGVEAKDKGEWAKGITLKTTAIKAPFTRERFHVEPYQNRTDRPRVYTVTHGTVPYRTASGTRTGPPRK